MNRVMKKILLFLLPFALIIFFLELLSSANFSNPALFPPPSQWASAFMELLSSGELAADVNASLGRLLAGLLMGSAIGVFAGLLTARNSFFNAIFSPVLNVLRSFPPVAIIPLVIVWLGIGEVSKIFSISFAVFFPVWISAHCGAQKVPENYLRAAKTLSCTGFSAFKKIVFPASLPFIVSGIRIGIGISFIMVFVSELAGASSGLGFQISISHAAYRIDKMIAALLVLGAFGALTDFAFTKSVNRLFSWVEYS